MIRKGGLTTVRMNVPDVRSFLPTGLEPEHPKTVAPLGCELYVTNPEKDRPGLTPVCFLEAPFDTAEPLDGRRTWGVTAYE